MDVSPAARGTTLALSAPILLYSTFLLALTFRPIQRGMVYLHWVKIPLFPRYDTPEAYGFSPNRVRNFYITTPDKIRLGAWHVLPQAVGSSYHLTAEIPEQAFDNGLRDDKHPVMLYFHGNAGTRLVPHRTYLARHTTSLFTNMNFVAIDYRGFADSSKVPPSEAGLLTDARAAWDWLTLTKRVPPENIVIAGQSLGTGVASALANQLANEGLHPRALFLSAPFTSIDELLLTYKAAEVIPLLQPLKYFPFIRKALFATLETHFNTLHIIQNIKCHVLLIHSRNDGTILHTHSDRLFRRLYDYSDVKDQIPSSHIRTQNIASFGTLRSFERIYEGDLTPGSPRSSQVVHLETQYGGHDNVNYAETTLHVMKHLIYEGRIPDAA